MAAITINDLHISRTLDRKAMSFIRGASAGWIYGWISQYVEAAPRFGPSINFYQTNNFYIADQMNNQIEMIDINNSAANSNINVNAKQQSLNYQHA